MFFWQSLVFLLGYDGYRHFVSQDIVVGNVYLPPKRVEHQPV